MWIDTGELVKLIEKLDETQSALQAYLADDTSDGELLRKVGERLAEMRAALYSDIAQADAPAGGALAEWKAPRKGGGNHG